MGRKLLRGLWLATYVGVLLVIFGVTSYLAFSQFVRRGVRPVPDLVGLSPEEGESMLADSGLTMRWLEGGDRFDEEVPAGRVLQHSPRAGSLVKKGSSVEIVLSRGRQLVAVPDLSGKALQAAQVSLAAAGLKQGRLASIFTRSGKPGTVVWQNPAAGSEVDRSVTVDLLVSVESSADVFVMPDLIYRSYDQVRDFFDRFGFRLGSVKFEAYEGIDEGIVLRQYPLAGHPLKRRDVISLVVAKVEPSG